MRCRRPAEDVSGAAPLRDADAFTQAPAEKEEGGYYLDRHTGSSKMWTLDTAQLDGATRDRTRARLRDLLAADHACFPELLPVWMKFL